MNKESSNVVDTSTLCVKHILYLIPHLNLSFARLLGS